MRWTERTPPETTRDRALWLVVAARLERFTLARVAAGYRLETLHEVLELGAAPAARKLITERWPLRALNEPARRRRKAQPPRKKEATLAALSGEWSTTAAVAAALAIDRNSALKRLEVLRRLRLVERSQQARRGVGKPHATWRLAQGTEAVR